MAATPDASTRGGPPAGWAAFRRLWFGQGVSQFGTAVSVVALPLVAVLTLHASPLEVGLLTSAEFIAYAVIGLLAGALVDRWDRRRVLLLTDLGRGAVTALVPLLAALGVLRMWQLYPLAVVLGVLSLFFETAYQAYLPSILSRDRLMVGNSRLQATNSAMQLVGPGAGGLLVQALGAATAMLVDAASYVVSFVALLSIRARHAASVARPARLPLRTQIGDGIRYVRGDPILPGVLGLLAYSNVMLAGQQALTVVFLVRVVHASPRLVGVLLAAGGAGAILGALNASRIARRLGQGRTLGGAALVGPILGLLIPLTRQGPALACFVVGSAGVTAAVIVFNVVGQSYRQATIPTHLLGRVVATMRTVTWGPLPLGGLIGGALGQAIGPRGGLVVLAVAQLCSPLFLIRSPAWRLTYQDVGMPVPAQRAAGRTGEVEGRPAAATAAEEERSPSA